MRIHPDHTYTTYTKHYYISSERINSKLGTINILGVLCEQMKGNDLIDEMNRRAMDAGERLEDLHTDLDKDLRLNSPYSYSHEHQFVCDFKSHNPELYDAYWYHLDHLGSTSYITNTTGEISQHNLSRFLGMEYLPFGETLVEEHRNSYNSPFKFNGKEYDAETGNYYYGARYMNPKWSTFLTPDPALESYPGISPYAYTLNNPVRYVDPTGMFVEDSKDPPIEIDGGALNPVHIIASSSGTNLTALGYSKADFSIRAQIIKDGGPIATALISAENKGLYRPLIDARRPYAGFSSEFSAGWNNIDKDGIGNFWMNATAVGVGVPLAAGIIGSYGGFQLSYKGLGAITGRSVLINMGIETTTELLSTGLKPGDMNLLAIGASAFGGKWSAQALGSSLSYTFNEGFYTYSIERSALNFGIGRANRGIHSMSSKLSNQWMFNSGFGKAFLPSFSIGIQSGLKTIPNEK